MAINHSNLHVRLNLERFLDRITPSAGQLDPSFGGDGKVMNRMSDGSDYALGIVIQPDGRIITAGLAGDGNKYDFGLARYLSDGQLDTSFGIGGSVLTPIGTSFDFGNAIALQPNGRIVVVGQSWNGSNYDFALARYNPDGTPDVSFGLKGQVTTALSAGNDIATGVIAQPDGKILVSGRSGDGSSSDFVVARYNADGSLDHEFDHDGIATTDFLGGEDYATGLVLQGDGGIVVGGSADVGNRKEFAAVRYLSVGSLDSTFGAGGKVSLPIGPVNDLANAIALQADDKIVLAGQTNNGSNQDFAVIRLLADGEVDPSFDFDGKATATFDAGDDVIRSIAIQADGGIVAAGYANISGIDNVAVARFLPDGSLDNSFNGNGKVTASYETGGNYANTVAVQTDGRILVAGDSWSGSSWDFTLLRYKPDGTLDRLADGDGIVTTNLGGFGDLARSVAVQPDGKILAAGNRTSNSSSDFAVVRYDTDGSLDPSFGQSGMAAMTVGPYGGQFGDMAIQNDGKIVLAGQTSTNASDRNFGIARLTSNGLPDPSFGTNGSTTLSIGNGDDQPIAVKIQSDGRIVVAGMTTGESSGRDFSVARFYSNGTVDTSFNSTGSVVTPIAPGAVDDWANDMIIQPDNKILVGGFSIFNGTWNFAMVRYNASGSLDASFDFDGIVTTAFSTLGDLAYAIDLQPDGKILLAGESRSGTSTSPISRIGIVRYNSDGSLDQAFGVDGKVTQSIGPIVTHAFTIKVQSDGKILVAGSSHIGHYQMFVARFNSDGNPDLTFASNGVLAIPFGGISGVQDIAIAPNGRIVLAGGATNITSSDYDFVIAQVRGDNHSPIPISTTLEVDEDQWLSITKADYYFDPDGDIATTTLLSGPQHGTLALTPYGTFTYIPNENFAGTDAFSYRLSDNEGGADVGSISIHVAPVNDAPVLSGETWLPAILQDSKNPAGTLICGLVSPLAHDLDGTIAGVAVVGNPADGEQGEWEYTTNGLDWFPIGNVSDGPNALLLAVASRLRFLPAPWFAGDVFPLIVRAIDSNFSGLFTLGAIRQTTDSSFNGEDTPVSTDTASVCMSVWPNATGGAWLSPNGNLIVEGTAANDVIAIKLSKDPSKLSVSLNRQSLGDFAATGIIDVQAGAGADRVRISSRVTRNSIVVGEQGSDTISAGGGNDTILGGDGNDKLNGGKGNDLLVGGEGNDVLVDATGQNVLIGGNGADRLTGGMGQDLLIAGPTNFDVDVTGLTNILREWTSQASYGDRISHLTGLPGGLNASIVLGAITVHDDAAKDILTGGGADDWFISSALDKQDLKMMESRLVV